MKKISLIPVIAFFCCFFLPGYGQEYSYKHYGIREGLVGNHVYHAIKDRTGFLWFATETGVSRFDGTAFKNFTTAEGLPDNEILKLFLDSKGRVWMLPFKNSVCYYYKGKIYNSGNDSNIKALPIRNYIQNMFEDTRGNIIFLESQYITVLTKEGKIFSTTLNPASTDLLAGGGLDEGSNLVIHADSVFYELKLGEGGKYTLSTVDFGIKFWASRVSSFYINANKIICANNFKNMFITHGMIIQDYKTKESDTIDLPNSINMISFFSDSLIFFNSQKGSIAYNFLRKKITNRYLENESVSFTLLDNESNLWFTTLERGIYRLSSEANKNIFFSDSAKRRKPVESIITTGGEIIIGSDENKVFVFNKRSGITRSASLLPTLSHGQIVKIKKYDNNIYFLSEGSLQRSDLLLTNITAFPQTELAMSYKDFDMDSNGEIYFASHLKVFSFSDKRDSIKYLVPLKGENRNSVMTNRLNYALRHSYYEGRTTAICYTDSGLYLGTIKGLKFLNWKKQLTDLGSISSLLRSRITELLIVKNKLWIGTNDEGVICFDGKRITKNILTRDGLTGNLVRALFADDNYLWVGTDRGLNKISLADTSYRVLQTYTTSDGITSDMINAVYAENDTVYIGTPEGMSFFSEADLKNNSGCDLQVLSITVSGKTISYDSAMLRLNNRDNNIRFDFVAISFKSEGDILYYYKLSGIDTEWRTTRENFLQYPTLPSGNYTMELYAVNKFGVKSKTVELNFEIDKKLFEQSWFIILVILLSVFIAWLLASWRIRKIKASQKARTANAEKIAELEQQALKAQMNPHFIFNCLNSIQQYVIDKDVQGANIFISGFARLIRQTLDNSGKQSITVAEEESFLRSYLELEKTRFEEKFDYAISISSEINKDECSLPPMLLQPYIENCIRHGIMHKSEGKGIIDIHFNLSQDNLICSITDNGIGREAAATLKRNQHINHHSKGTELTSQRITMINKNNDAAIILKTEDLKDVNQQPCGTKVTIVIPLQSK